MEGVLPNVTVTLTLPPNGSPLQDILVHPCVTSLDLSILTASSVDNSDSSAFSGPYKFPFSPPLEPFRLCSYTSQVEDLHLLLTCFSSHMFKVLPYVTLPTSSTGSCSPYPWIVSTEGRRKPAACVSNPQTSRKCQEQLWVLWSTSAIL